VARIAAPAAGAIIALDPDIPDARERVALEADPPDASLRFRLDGADLGHAGGLVLWAPARGGHELALLDAAGRALDSVRFEVR
jgi:penicillin-binding protein 1C